MNTVEFLKKAYNLDVTKDLGDDCYQLSKSSFDELVKSEAVKVVVEHSEHGEGIQVLSALGFVCLFE